MKTKKELNPAQQLAAELFSKVKDTAEAKQMLKELYKSGIEAV